MTKVELYMFKGNIKYLCLQATLEGQASYAHVHEISKELQALKWSVSLFEPTYKNPDKLPGTVGRLLEFIKVQSTLWLDKEPVDILYIRSHFATFPSVLWAKLNRIPCIYEVNGPYEDLFIVWPTAKKVSFLINWLKRTQMRWADRVITVTPELKDWVIKETGGGSVHVVPNGANTEHFKLSSPLRELEQRKPYVLFFGSMTAWQGIETVLEAVSHRCWPKQVNLLFVGDGSEREKVEEAGKLDSRISYIGKQPYTRMPSIIAGSLAGLSVQNNLEGRSETGLSPLKVYEALACGVPVIVSDFPGQADLVRSNRCGIVIPPEDSSALAIAVNFLIDHKSERIEMSARGRAAIERDHSWQRRAAATESICLELVADS